MQKARLLNGIAREVDRLTERVLWVWEMRKANTTWHQGAKCRWVTGESDEFIENPPWTSDQAQSVRRELAQVVIDVQ